MNQPRMTWEDIKRTYPNEWVVLVDVDADHEIPEVRGGTVAAHGRHRKETLLAADLTIGEGWALKFTGRRTGAYLFFEKYLR